MWRAPRLCFSVVTSFTFFGELQFLNLDREWRQAEANQARAIFDETKRHVREMVTAAWIDAEVRQLDPDTQNAFALFFRNVAHSSNSTVTSWAVAEKLAKTAPSVSVANEKKLGPDGLVSEPAQAMLASTNSIDGALPENIILLLPRCVRSRKNSQLPNYACVPRGMPPSISQATPSPVLCQRQTKSW